MSYSITETMYEKRMKMLEAEPDLKSSPDYMWDVVICPECADVMLRGDTVIDTVDDNGQMREFECCPKCMKQVVTMYNFKADEDEKYKMEVDNYAEILRIYAKRIGKEMKELREW